jgi:hypothetical protein
MQDRPCRQIYRIAAPNFTEAFLKGKDPAKPTQRVAVIAISSVFLFCGLILGLDAIGSYNGGGAGFYITALPAILLVVTGIVGIWKALRNRRRSGRESA